MARTPAEVAASLPPLTDEQVDQIVALLAPLQGTARPANKPKRKRPAPPVPSAEPKPGKRPKKTAPPMPRPPERNNR